MAEHARGADTSIDVARLCEDTGVAVLRWRVWPDEALEYVSPAAARFAGAPAHELLADRTALAQLVTESDRAKLRESAEDPRTAGQPVVVRWRARDGRQPWMEHRTRAIRDESGRTIALEHLASDVTARVEGAHEDLRFRRLLERANDVVTITAMDGAVVYQSPAAERVFGRGPLRTGERIPYADVHPDDRAHLQDAQQQVRRQPGARLTVTYRVQPEGGMRRVLETTLTNESGNPELGGIFSYTRDVTEQARAEEALKLSEQSFRTLIEQLPVGVGVLRERTIVYANPELERILGASRGALVGRTLASIGPQHQHAAVHERADRLQKERQIPTREGVMTRADGSEVHVEASGLQVVFGGQAAMASLVRDLTEHRRMQAQLRLADRMASLGTLAAGVAHEINNPLAYLLVNLDWMRDEVLRLQAAAERQEALFPKAFDEVVTALDEVHDGCLRVRRIVRDLKTFSRADDETRAQVDVAQIIESCLGVAASEIRHRARVVKRFTPVPCVEANESRLGQVFLNLLVNAAQAIGEGDPDRHEIRVEVRPGAAGEVVAEVRDTGCGIAPQHIEHVFDPFFTTKPVGVGTGLGLSICHGLVSALGGRLEVESELGQGSVFRVVLPASSGTPVEHSGSRPSALGAIARARVLVIDDEAQVGFALERLLRDEHDVECEVDPRRALARLLRGEHFDVVLCDLMMPHLSGMSLYEQLRQARPGQAARVVFITGGAFTAAAAAFLEQVPNRRLEKPFDPAEVRAAIEAVHAEQ